MNCSSVGIVLRQTRPVYKKISLLDKKYGRIECIGNLLYQSVGTVVTYTIYTKNNHLFVQDMECLYMPLSLGKADVLFLHHIFEVIFYFAPIGSCVKGVFDLLAFLYTIEHMLISIRFKKFFLFKLLTLLGVVPEIEGLRSVYIYQLQSISIDIFDETILDKEGEKKLDKWLWGCIWQHPYVNEFKTVHFLEQNRAT